MNHATTLRHSRAHRAAVERNAEALDAKYVTRVTIEGSEKDWRGGMDKWRDTTGHRVANATPEAFREVLLSIARKTYNGRDNRNTGAPHDDEK